MADGELAGAIFRPSSAPFYVEMRDEVRLFEAAFAERLPVLLKGPTGCGKTRFVEYMAWRLLRDGHAGNGGLVTVTCHDDLTASDLVGRFLLHPSGTEWMDGPLTTAVRQGAICYLDEVVEARQDTTVVIHALTDHRRLLPMEKLGTTLRAHPDFLLVVSYNPGYQAVSKEMKPSTRQRFVAIEFDYPEVATEAAVIAHEAGIDAGLAGELACLAASLRNLDGFGYIDGPSTRLMIYVGRLVRQGIAVLAACEAGLVRAVTDDPELQDGVREVVRARFGDGGN